MQKLLAVVIGVLTVVAVVVLVVAVEGQYHIWMGTADPQRYTLLPGIVVSVGVLIAALSFLREKAKTDVERSRHVSEVLLAQASAGFDAAVELLSDQNNNRMTWIRAARTLLQAQSLGRRIDSPEYAVAYKLAEERTRNELYKILTTANIETNARQPLPPQFFYGVKDWHSGITLDDAAIRASSKVEAYSINIDTVPPPAGLLPLAARSVVAIFAFVEYPKDYDDPLDDVVEWDENWNRSLGIDQGARRYVAHTKMKTAVNGKLFDKTPKANG